MSEETEPELEDERDEVGEVEDELGSIAEEPENRDEELGDDEVRPEGIADKLKGNPTKV